MKPLKASQLRQMTRRELEKELEKHKSDLYALRVQKSRHQLKDVNMLRITRRNIARILSVLGEKEAV